MGSEQERRAGGLVRAPDTHPARAENDALRHRRELRDNHRVSVSYAQPPADPTEVLGRRFAALLTDLLLLGVIGAILVATAKHRGFYDAPANACEHLPNRGSSVCLQIGDRLYLWDRGVLIRALLLTLAAGFLDLVVVQSLMGGSVGKLCVGLRVIEASGHEARFLRMVGRWVFLAVDLGCFLVGLVTTLATHPHRRVGDLVCGTYVVATSSVGQPVIVASYPPPGSAPPPGYGPAVAGQYPAGWGGPSGTGDPPGWNAPPIVTPPGTTPTTPGAWGAVARPAPPLVRSPHWQTPPPGTAEPAPDSLQSTAPQWAAPPAVTAEPAAPPADASGDDDETARAETARKETIVAQWSPVVPLKNHAGTPLAAPVRADPPSPAPSAAVSQWTPLAPAAPANDKSARGEPQPPVPPPTPPAPPPPTEPPPTPPTEPPPPPPAAEDDEVPWWDTDT